MKKQIKILLNLNIENAMNVHYLYFQMFSSHSFKFFLLLDVHTCVSVSCSVQLCDFMDYSQPGFPIHGILQVRILE